MIRIKLLKRNFKRQNYYKHTLPWEYTGTICSKGFYSYLNFFVECRRYSIEIATNVCAKMLDSWNNLLVSIHFFQYIIITKYTLYIVYRR